MLVNISRQRTSLHHNLQQRVRQRCNSAQSSLRPRHTICRFLRVLTKRLFVARRARCLVRPRCKASRLVNRPHRVLSARGQGSPARPSCGAAAAATKSSGPSDMPRQRPPRNTNHPCGLRIASPLQTRQSQSLRQQHPQGNSARMDRCLAHRPYLTPKRGQSQTHGRRTERVMG